MRERTNTEIPRTQAEGSRAELASFPGEAVPLCPAPWTLDGRGYMLLYRFSRAQRGRIGWESGESRGFGALMLVDYASSDAGPYREALFMPGRLVCPRGRRYRITRIFVSSMASVVNGRLNWAIPKEPADFEFAAAGADRERVAVLPRGAERPALSAIFEARGPRFPVNTALLPFPLAQPDGGEWVYTDFQGVGTGRLARVKDLSCDAAQFPDLRGIRPLLALAIDPFRITFPVARRDKPAGGVRGGR